MITAQPTIGKVGIDIPTKNTIQEKISADLVVNAMSVFVTTHIPAVLGDTAYPVTQDEPVSEPFGEALLEMMDFGLINIGCGPIHVLGVADEPSTEDPPLLAFGYDPAHGSFIDYHDGNSVSDVNMLPLDAQSPEPCFLPCCNFCVTGQDSHPWITKKEVSPPVYWSSFAEEDLNCGMAQSNGHDKLLNKRKNNMTKYKLEFYEKNARRPYRTEYGELPNGFHPKWTNSQECFNFALSHIGGRVKIRYASNGGLAGETYIDVNGNGRVRWFKN